MYALIAIAACWNAPSIPGVFTGWGTARDEAGWRTMCEQAGLSLHSATLRVRGKARCSRPSKESSSGAGPDYRGSWHVTSIEGETHPIGATDLGPPTFVAAHQYFDGISVSDAADAYRGKYPKGLDECAPWLAAPGMASGGRCRDGVVLEYLDESPTATLHYAVTEAGRPFLVVVRFSYDPAIGTVDGSLQISDRSFSGPTYSENVERARDGM